MKSDAGTPLADAAAEVPPAPPTFSSPPPAFPPPDPTADNAANSRTVGLLTLLALTGLAIGAIMTILWFGTRGDVDDAVAERDLAISERDTATESLTTAQTELQATTDALGATEQDLAEALAALEAAGSADPAEPVVPADVDPSGDLAALEAQIAELQTTATAAAAENARLTEELEAAGAAEPAPATPAEFDVDSTPDFARWVGELLSSSRGSSRLGQNASTCFGAAVIDLIGVDAIGNGQNNSASGSERQVVIDAMVTAAGTCDIDTGLIF